MEEARRNEGVFSKSVRAGKRTYFFDIKATRANDLFLTITESKKRINESGEAFFEKHKIYLYKEDFEKFMDGIHETFNRFDELMENRPQQDVNERVVEPNSDPQSASDLRFEDL